MTQSNLLSSLEQGTDGDKSSSDFPQICLYQVAILVAMILRFGSSRFVSEPEGETSPAIGFLMPFFIGFLIWPVIYLFQWSFSFWQLFQRPGRAPAQRLAAIQGLTPAWIAMSLITVAWRFAPNLWLAGCGLTGVVISLYFSWLAVVGEKESWQDYLLLNVPITLHLGWGTAAALLTWNNVVAEMTTSVAVNLGFLIFELVLAGGLGSFLALRHKSPLLVGAVAWAVMWVGVETLVTKGQRLERYNTDLGEAGRITLGVVEILLAVGLIGVGIRART